jgi:hypothetical protein
MSHQPALAPQRMGVMYRPPIVAPQLKRCWLCEEELPVEEFGADHHRRDGLQVADRFCMRLYNRERYDSRREALRNHGRDRGRGKRSAVTGRFERRTA